MKKSGIAVLYLSAGSGHQMAAESLADCIKQREPKLPLIVEDPFVNRIEILPSVISALQTVSLIMAPGIYDMAWRRKINYDKYQWLEDINILQQYLTQKLSSLSIDRVIATHVLPSILGVGLKKRSVISELYSVITDFGAHSFWPTADVDKYFVGTEELKNVLVYRGVDKSCIHVSGIPIRMGQSHRRTAKRSGHKTRVLIVAGGLRSGSYIHLRRFFYDLMEGLGRIDRQMIDITIVTGSQKDLRKELHQLTQYGHSNIRIMGLVPDLPKLMAAQDVLITKPGGLIVAEALAVGICLVLLQSGPGQENANAEFLARQGIALRGETPEQVVKVVESLIKNPETMSELKSRTKSFGFPNSTKTIVDSVLH